MSDKSLARRTAVKVFFDGIDITNDLDKYLLSLTYTDNEEDETDDLQLKLHDRDGLWREKWLNEAIMQAAGGSKSSAASACNYVVTAKSGLNVRSGQGTNYKKLGTLACGTNICVESISGNWAKISYSGKTAYVHTDYIQKITTATTTSSDAWNVGDSVVVNGRPQYSSYGDGSPGANVTNYSGKITRLNLKNNAPYPIHVGYLGWFSIEQVQRIGGESVSVDGASKKGLSIQAVIVRQNWHDDGKDDLLECGQFELDSVQASGPPATVTMKGTSLPYSSTIRQTEKSKAWESYKLSGIAHEIANKHGMTCMYLSSVDPLYNRVEQYKQSDIAFLQKLCHDAGCSLKVSNNIIVIFEQSSYEKKSVVKTIEHGENGGYINYKLSTGKDNTYSSCCVSYVASNGKCISATAYIEDYKEDKEDNQCLKISQKVTSVAEAQSLAEMFLKLYNKFAFNVSFTFPGDPKLLAGCTVELRGWGAFDGRYIIKQSKHSVGNNGYTTQINLRKVIS